MKYEITGTIEFPQSEALRRLAEDACRKATERLAAETEARLGLLPTGYRLWRSNAMAGEGAAIVYQFERLAPGEETPGAGVIYERKTDSNCG